MKAMDSVQPYQIVYLEKGSNRLYAEVIQVVPERQLCWARPLLLVEALPASLAASEGLSPTEVWTQAPAHVLIDSPDILWPLRCFELALDSEVVPLLGLLQDQSYSSKMQRSDRASSQQRLRQFIHEFWQA
jgi:hypothetical protein